MRKSFNLIWMVFGFLLLIVGCNEDKKSTAFDPNQPVKFTEFMPDSGGIRTKFIVKGSNFGEDKSQVKVYFKDEVGNEREALVLGVKPDVIYAQVPKQAGGESHVRVEVSGKKLNSAMLKNIQIYCNFFRIYSSRKSKRRWQ